MKTFKIPVFWECTGHYIIEAEDLEEAVEEAYDLPLPEGSYVEDSFQVEVQFVEEVSKEDSSEGEVV